jgi:hypothetical protein
MLQYKAGYKFVEGGVHAQVLDFPAAITCADTLPEARRLLAIALVDVAEAAMETGPHCRRQIPRFAIPRWILRSRFICGSISGVSVAFPASRSLHFLSSDFYLREAQIHAL